MLLWRFVYKFLCWHMFSFFLCRYLGVELQGHMLTLCLTFWGPAKLFYKAAEPFYIPTSNVWGFQFLHILINICYCLAFSFSYPNGYEVVVLIYISQMTNDVEHVFICLLDICISSLEKCLFKSFAHLKIKLFVFLLLNYNSSLYALDTSLLSDAWFANICSHSFFFLINLFIYLFIFDCIGSSLLHTGFL